MESKLPFAGYFPSERINEIWQNACRAGLADSRLVLLNAIDRTIAERLPDAANPAEQLLSDLQRLNWIDRLEGGAVPLQQWLAMAVHLAGSRQQGAILRQALAEVTGYQPLPPKKSEPLCSLATFVGRQDEVDKACARLRDVNVRLLTFSGPPGVGKTCLAEAVAGQLVNDFPDGVFRVPLYPLGNQELVLSTIAQELGIKTTMGQSLLDSLKTSAGDKRILLILDSFEHVMGAAALLEELAAAPGLKILVTSREILRLPSETEFEVPQLGLPKRGPLPAIETLLQYDAVNLFVQRAQIARPDFRLTSDNAPDVVEICDRVDGLPLAIELAAAWSLDLTPRDIVARMERGPLPTRIFSRIRPERLQRMDAAIDWSYELLNPTEQTLFARLAVFRGSFTLDAVEAICKAQDDLAIDVLEGLMSLVDKSLLQIQRPNEERDESRFSLLGILHEYGERLLAHRSAEAAILRERHAKYYLVLGEETKAHLEGFERHARLSNLHLDYGNFSSVLEWSQTEAGDIEVGLRLAVALEPYWYDHALFKEASQWLEGLLEKSSEAPPSLRAEVLTYAGLYKGVLYDLERAESHLKDSLCLSFSRIQQDLNNIARGYAFSGFIESSRGEFDKAAGYLQQSITWSQLNRNEHLVALAECALGIALYRNGKLEEAALRLQKSLDLRKRGGPPWGTALAQNYLGLVQLAQGKLDEALSICEQSLSLSRDIRYEHGIALSLASLGHVWKERRDYEKAASYLWQSLEKCKEQGDKRSMAERLDALAEVAELRSQWPCAVRLAAAARRLWHELRGAQPDSLAAAPEDRLPSAYKELGPDSFKTAWIQGESWPVEQVLAHEDCAERS